MHGMGPTGPTNNTKQMDRMKEEKKVKCGGHRRRERMVVIDWRI